MVRETVVQSQVELYQTLKNGTWWRTQHDKKKIKDKVEQFMEWSSAVSYTSV